MVCAFTQLLEERYGRQLDAQAGELIGFAVEGARRMQRLIEDLLAYSRVTTLGAPLARVALDGALDEALARLRSLIEETEAVVSREPLPVVRGDAGQLAQLLQNLVGNALKFRRPGVPPRVAIRARREPDGAWRVEVADHGIGIDTAHRERVFVIFQRLHTREEYPGSGIGLALCKRIVERHGGAIWLEPTPGGGTCCCFTLGAADEAP